MKWRQNKSSSSVFMNPAFEPGFLLEGPVNIVLLDVRAFASSNGCRHAKWEKAMPFSKLAISLSAVLIAVSAAYAQDPISDRQKAMKMVGAAAKASSEMIKGEKPFDAAVALESFQTMNDVAKDFVSLFPEGSETGGDTEASPKIWEDRAGFEAAVAKFEADSAEAIAAAPSDLDAFKASFGKVAANCGACHKAYRVSKN